VTDDEDEERDDLDIDEDVLRRLDWTELGTTAPRVPAGPAEPRRDLGPGGSLRQDATEARRRRLARLGRLDVTALRRTPAEQRLIARAAAQRRVAAELDSLTADGWVLLHDRTLPGGAHRVAHVAVGPAGVFIVTDLPDGPLRIVGELVDDHDGRELYVGSLYLAQWLRARRWEVAQLEPAIADAYQDAVWCGPTAAIAVAVPPARRPRHGTIDTDVPEMPSEWHGVELRPLSALVATLTALPGPLPRNTVAHLAAVVEQACPPAGRAEAQETSNKPA
jgi:hypothetical protein